MIRFDEYSLSFFFHIFDLIWPRLLIIRPSKHTYTTYDPLAWLFPLLFQLQIFVDRPSSQWWTSSSAHTTIPQAPTSGGSPDFTFLLFYHVWSTARHSTDSVFAAFLLFWFDLSFLCYSDRLARSLVVFYVIWDIVVSNQHMGIALMGGWNQGDWLFEVYCI
jgi:hypothetical protein